MPHHTPHRYPFQMVDRVLELEPGKRAKTIKLVSGDDPLVGKDGLSGHLIVEALAQTAGIALQQPGGAYLVKVEEMRLHGRVVPGTMLILQAEVEFNFGGMAKIKVKAEGDGVMVAEGVVVLAQQSR